MSPDASATGTQTANHVVVVTLNGCDPREDHPDEPHNTFCFDSEVECPTLTDYCRSWMECAVAECQQRKTRDRDVFPDDDEGVFHGVRHKWANLDGYCWATPEDVCFYVTSDSTCDAIADLDLRKEGRYPIEVEVDDVYPVFRLMDGASR